MSGEDSYLSSPEQMIIKHPTAIVQMILSLTMVTMKKPVMKMIILTSERVFPGKLFIVPIKKMASYDKNGQ